MKNGNIQQIADALNISRVTVWKALNGKPGVSSQTVQKVISAASVLREQETGIAASVSQAPVTRNVLLAVARANSSAFWLKIIDEIANELRSCDINLIYTPAELDHIGSDNLSNLIRNNHAQGMIVINVYDVGTLSAIAALPLPKVFLDTVPGVSVQVLSGDLVLLEGEATVAGITGALLAKGCRRIGFIGDIAYARTNHLRWEGYCRALREAGIEPDMGICLTGPIGVNTYRQELDAFLDRLDPMPEAFVCASDFLAYNVINHLKHQYRFPDDISVTGYDDSPEFFMSNYAFTTAHVQNEIIGKRLVSQLLFRIGNPDADYEEIYIFPKPVIRNI